jgi:hypothetical protein
MTYARCSCGVVGCGSDSVIIARTEDTVSWKHRSEKKKSFLFGGWHKEDRPFVFDRRAYDDAVIRLANDFSWETTERTAERLIRNLDFTRFIDYGLEFQWASGRTENKVALSFGLQENEAKYQIVCYAPWNHEVASDAVSAIEALLKDPPSLWSEVVYHFQSQVRPRPKIAGTGWSEHNPHFKK